MRPVAHLAPVVLIMLHLPMSRRSGPVQRLALQLVRVGGGRLQSSPVVGTAVSGTRELPARAYRHVRTAATSAFAVAAGMASIGVHPLVLLNIADHSARSAVQAAAPARRVGVVFGTQVGRQVEICASSDMALRDDDDDAAIDHDDLRDVIELRQSGVCVGAVVSSADEQRARQTRPCTRRTRCSGGTRSRRRMRRRVTTPGRSRTRSPRTTSRRCCCTCRRRAPIPPDASSCTSTRPAPATRSRPSSARPTRSSPTT